jgi:hypothetical protein
MAGKDRPQWDLLLVVTSDRYGSALFGTIRRIVDSALRGGHSVQVWACGYANMLTELPSAPDDQPDGPACCSGDQRAGAACAADTPATAELIGALATGQPDRFSWVACRTCSDDRGAGEHVSAVLTAPSFANFREYVDNAAKTVYIGGA